MKTDKITCYIEQPIPVTRYVFDFLFKILGINGEICIDNPEQPVHIYHGNNYSSSKNKCLIINRNDKDIIQPGIIDGTLKPENAGKKLEFDIINAISKLLTDEVNSNQGEESFDEHNRLIFENSFQYINQVHEIPLVNLYINFLCKLIELNGQITRAPLWPDGKSYAIGLSHDVDIPDKYAVLKSPFFLKSKSVRSNLFHNYRKAYYWFKYLNDKSRHDYWLFDEIVDHEVKHGFSSTFFFATIPNYFDYGSRLDVDYNIEDKLYQKVFENILNNNCEIGLHASYNAYKNADYFIEEKEQLEKYSGTNVKGLRHHYWHMDRNYINTLKFHETAEFNYDSSIAFNHSLGFRSNTALPFYPWYAKENRPLKVMQLPVFAMDGNLFYQDMEIDQALEIIKKYILMIKKAGGIGIIDWHVKTSFPVDNEYRNWGECYVQLIKYLASDNEAWVSNLGDIHDWIYNTRFKI